MVVFCREHTVTAQGNGESGATGASSGRLADALLRVPITKSLHLIPIWLPNGNNSTNHEAHEAHEGTRTPG